MIPALIALFFLFSGGGTAPFADLVSHFESAAKKAIVDTAQRDAARDVLKQMDTAIKGHEKSRDQTIKALEKLGENHAATEAEYRAIFDAQQASDAAFQETIITLYGKLKTHITTQEWAVLTAGMPSKQP